MCVYASVMATYAEGLPIPFSKPNRHNKEENIIKRFWS